MRSRGVCVSLVAVLSGCGSPSPTAPAAANPVATPAPTPTPFVLQVVSAETGAPVAGTRVAGLESDLTTDADGRVTLPVATAPDAAIDLFAEGFLGRNTSPARAESGRLSLWPRTSPTGLDERFTGEIVYSSDEGFADAPLRRWPPSQGRVEVILGPGFGPELGRGNDNHVDATVEVNAMLAGRLTYAEPVFGDRTDARGTLLVTVNPDDPACEGRVLAVSRRYVDGRGQTFRYEIAYCTVFQTQRPNIVRHEMGHTLGLRHSTNRDDLMHPTDTAAVFRDRERLVVQLMYQRPAGNLFPDNDRSAAGPASQGLLVETLVCRE